MKFLPETYTPTISENSKINGTIKVDVDNGIKTFYCYKDDNGDIWTTFNFMEEWFYE